MMDIHSNVNSIQANMDAREQIITEAAKLFFIHGVKKIKMDTIARRLKISKRTIYENFRNKDSLIRETIDQNQREQMKINTQIIDESKNIIEAVLVLLKTGSEILSQINPAYYADLRRLYPSIWKEKIQEGKAHSFRLITDLLKKGKQQGVYMQDINEEIIALILIEQLFMISDPSIFPPKKYKISEIYENIIISMTRGVATRYGIELLENYRYPD